MKKITYILLFFAMANNLCFTQESNLDLKESAFALYNTNHPKEAKALLDKIPNDKKDEEIYLILANIYEEENDLDSALFCLQKSVELNPKYYKSYYNLGCIYAKKRIYTEAVNQFKFASKYNKNNPYVFYNLGCAYMNLGEYKEARKNFIRAICLKNDEKIFYYNLALANKKLNKEKDAKKILDFYNKTFTQNINS